MTTHDLARLLLAGPDVRVVVDGRDGGYDEPHLRAAVVALDDGDGYGYGGEHGDVWRSEVLPSSVPCVLISRAPFVRLDHHCEAETFAEALVAVSETTGGDA